MIGLIKRIAGIADIARNRRHRDRFGVVSGSICAVWGMIEQDFCGVESFKSFVFLVEAKGGGVSLRLRVSGRGL
jgi:hypothetical protein